MSEPVRIVVPYDVHLLSLNQRLHWRARKERNDNAKTAARYAYAVASRPVFTEAVRFSLLVRRGRVIDRDNAITGAKPMVDAFVREGMLPGDGPKWVYWGEVEFETGKRFENAPEVVFTVEPVGCRSAAGEEQAK